MREAAYIIAIVSLASTGHWIGAGFLTGYALMTVFLEIWQENRK